MYWFVLVLCLLHFFFFFAQQVSNPDNRDVYLKLGLAITGPYRLVVWAQPALFLRHKF